MSIRIERRSHSGLVLQRVKEVLGKVFSSKHGLRCTTLIIHFLFTDYDNRGVFQYRDYFLSKCVFGIDLLLKCHTAEGIPTSCQSTPLVIPITVKRFRFAQVFLPSSWQFCEERKSVDVEWKTRNPHGAMETVLITHLTDS